MTKTPIKDELSSISKTAHIVGWVNGRDTMKRDVLSILWSLPKTKATAEAIRRVNNLVIHREGEQK